jgi:Protein of unknown function (DUF4238)
VKRKKTKHHYLPQMLLRRFAEDDQIATVDRVHGKVRVGRTSETAAVSGFYEYLDQEGGVRDDLETAFASLEGVAQGVIERLHVRPVGQISLAEKEVLCTFVAVQFLRTPEFRRATELITEWSFKREVAELIHDETSARDSFINAGIDPTDEKVSYFLASVRSGLDDIVIRPHPNDYFQHFFSLWPDLSEKLLARQVWIRSFPVGSLLLSDHPVLFVTQVTTGSYETGGIENAGEIWFPISSSRLLILSSPSVKMRQHGDPELKYRVNPETHNFAQIQHCSEYYFGPPSLIHRMKIKALGKRIFVQDPGHPHPEGSLTGDFDPKPGRLSSFETRAPRIHRVPPKAP